MARLFGSASGAISRLVLFAPVHEARDYARVYGALVESMDPPVEIHVAAVTEALRHVRAWPCDTQRLVIHDVGACDITPWACDPWLAGGDGGTPLLWAAPALDRRDDASAALRLAGLAGMPVCMAKAAFEGGNLLVGEDVLLVGADTLAEAGADDFAAALAAFERPARRIVPIGCNGIPKERAIPPDPSEGEWQQVFHWRSRDGSRQPVFHIDMFVTLAGAGPDGRERVLVGDPAMAASLLGHEPHPLCMAEAFDRVATDLAAQGCAVIRNPLPMIYMDEPDRRCRTWYYASSNNALVQVSDDAGDVVWLPAFGHDNWPGLAATDDANRAIWEALGFEVRMIGDAQRLAENAGGLHCLANVAGRR